jgi:hypothetical protein
MWSPPSPRAELLRIFSFQFFIRTSRVQVEVFGVCSESTYLEIILFCNLDNVSNIGSKDICLSPLQGSNCSNPLDIPSS